LEELPAELKPKPDNYFYKKHSDHVGFKAPTTTTTELASAHEVPEASLDSRKKTEFQVHNTM
jgi:hypothetical protein